MKRVRVLSILCLAGAIFAGDQQHGQADILVASLVQDTHVESSNPTATIAASPWLWVRNHSTVSRLALVQFELPQLPAGMLASSISEVQLSGTVYRSAAASQQLDVLVLGTNPVLTGVNYNAMVAADVIESRTVDYNFEYGSGATLIGAWTGLPQGLSSTEPHYHRATYIDDNAVDGLLYWVRQTISDSGPSLLTLAFGPSGATPTCDFRFWSTEGATGSTNNPPACVLPAIPLTLTLIPEPSSAVLALLAMVGGMTVCSRRRRKE
ncbi:MAG: hypothetical protein U1E05_16675 [Patescibacteria group bacterium]|nr:hypothetical protein [Patescibacteria group bacterium]